MFGITVTYVHYAVWLGVDAAPVEARELMGRGLGRVVLPAVGADDLSPR